MERSEAGQWTRCTAKALRELGEAFTKMTLPTIEAATRLSLRETRTVPRWPRRKPGSTLTLKQQQKRKQKNKNAKNARKRNRK